MSPKSAQEIWETALGELELQISKSNFRTWLDKTVGVKCTGEQFVIGVPNTFIAEYLDKNQRSMIEKTLIGLLQKPVTVTFTVSDSPEAPSASYRTRAELPATSKQNRLNAQYTFDSFVVSDCNRLAYTAALGAAENPGQRTYNPLFIFSGPGMGKTHLLHAIGHVAQANQQKVMFTNAEQFTNDFVNSIRDRKTEDFRSKYRSADILLLDDIQFLSGKEQTEDTFFHIFNDLHDSNRQIAVTSDCPPKSIPQIEERLRSRLGWGLTAGIRAPDLDTRLAILRAKAQRENLNLDAEVLETIADTIKKNVRELEGALNKVIAYARMLKVTVTPAITSQALQEIAVKLPHLPPAPATLLEAVAKSFQIPLPDLKSHKRDRQTVLARHVAIYLLRSETNWSLAQIGKELGGREPITISQAYRKVTEGIKQDTELKQKITSIHEELSQQQQSK